MAAVKTRLVKIGNSRGVRIPKVLIEQAGLGTEVEIAAQPDQIVIRSSRCPREGWEEQFARMHAAGDDALLDEFTPTEWDEREWQWS